MLHLTVKAVAFPVVCEATIFTHIVLFALSMLTIEFKLVVMQVALAPLRFIYHMTVFTNFFWLSPALYDVKAELFLWTSLQCLLCYTPTTKCGGGHTGFALSRRSVGRSVRPSVRPSPIRVRSITPLLMEWFPSNLKDTFTSTRGCAEPMLPMCQLKVKVTVKCQILNKQI